MTAVTEVCASGGERGEAVEEIADSAGEAADRDSIRKVGGEPLQEQKRIHGRRQLGATSVRGHEQEGHGMRSALCLLAGVLLGVAGHAVHRGDLPWQRPAPQVTAEPAVEEPQAQPAPAEALLPELPISLSFHEDAKGRGYIVQFHNTSQKHRAVLVELKNPTLDSYRAAPVQLAAGELREIGEAQDWTLVSGDTITVREDGHSPRSLTIP